MDTPYHVQVLARAVGARLSPRALAAVTRANLGQDSLRGLLHVEYHFDNSAFAASLAYMEACRAQAAAAADPAVAWAAFGRLSHAAQDFYSHSNYVHLWRARYPEDAPPPVEAIDGLDPSLLRHAGLVSGRIYLADALALIPALQGLAWRLAPPDSHARMNLDTPATGPLFPYSLEAAVQRTVAEFERTLAAIGEAQGTAAIAAFCDR